MHIPELRDLSSRPADSTSDVQYLHSFLETHSSREVVLVSCDCLEQWLVGCETAEVEGLAPCLFVQAGSKVVVAVKN